MRIDHVALFCKDLEQMRLTFPNGDARLELMQRPDTI